jgi:TPR repeat protein
MYVGTQVASLLVGKSQKTLYRWVEEEKLAPKVQTPSSGPKAFQKMLFNLEDLKPYLTIPVDGALEEDLARAEAGEADAYTEVGLRFFAAERYDQAFRWLELAAQKGHADGMDWLATCYLRGLGTPENRAAAMEWLGRAARAGHVLAQKKIQAI